MEWINWWLKRTADDKCWLSLNMTILLLSWKLSCGIVFLKRNSRKFRLIGMQRKKEMLRHLDYYIFIFLWPSPGIICCSCEIKSWEKLMGGECLLTNKDILLLYPWTQQGGYCDLEDTFLKIHMWKKANKVIICTVALFLCLPLNVREKKKLKVTK